jgi:hypothetical protein
MPCSEYLRLEQRFEAALRSWVQSMASSSQLFGQPMYLTVQARQRALEDRNAAKNRLWVMSRVARSVVESHGPVFNRVTWRKTKDGTSHREDDAGIPC